MPVELLLLTYNPMIGRMTDAAQLDLVCHARLLDQLEALWRGRLDRIDDLLGATTKNTTTEREEPT